MANLPLQGRRLPDTPRGEHPADIQAGDYWKLLGDDGLPVQLADQPTNLTGTQWMVAAPLGKGAGFGIGNLVRHTVREHEDGTISVRPGDGSSNSILITRPGTGDQFHGYIEHGLWHT